MAITRHAAGGWNSTAETRDTLREMETGAVLTPRFKLWNFNVRLNFILARGGVRAAQAGLEAQYGEGVESSWPGP